MSTKVIIDLGKRREECGGPCGIKESNAPKTYYPSVYLSDLPGLEDCPEEFYIKCRRSSITVRETKDDKGESSLTSVEAECLEMICDKPTKKEKSWMDSFAEVETV